MVLSGNAHQPLPLLLLTADCLVATPQTNNTTVLLISLVWPSAAPAHYLQRRTPALAFLQLFLFALPFNFDTGVFNALAPRPGEGRLAWIFDAFSLAMSERGDE